MEQDTSTVQTTVGIDLGDRFSHLCVLDATGEILDEGRVRTTGAALRQRFSTPDSYRIAIEVGTHSPWVSRVLSELGHEVLVANPAKLRLIYQNTKKNDRVDAQYLARLARVDPKLLSPIQHRNGQAQTDLALLRARDTLVSTRTKLINHVRGAVKSTGGRLPACDTRSFSKKVLEDIPESLKPALAPLVAQIDAVCAEIRGIEKRLRKLATEQYPETQILRQVPGVGLMTALAFVLTIEDPRRFRRSRSVAAYLGLTPRQRDSGSSTPQLRISKAGDSALRRLLVNCAQYILGPFGPPTDLREWGLKLAERGGRSAKRKAIVAVARRLAILLHRLWSSGEVYEPIRLQRT